VLTPSLAGQWLPRGEESEPIRNLVMVTSTVIALAGIGFAAFLYLGEDAQPIGSPARCAPFIGYRMENFSSIRFTIGWSSGRWRLWRPSAIGWTGT